MNQRQRLPGEITFIVLLLAASAFLLWQAWRISGFESITSAGVFPMLAALTMLLALVDVLRRTRRLPPAPAGQGEPVARQFARQLVPPVLVGFTIAIAAYMLLMERLGFLLSSYLFLVASMVLLGSRRLLLNLVVSALMLGAIYLVFQTVFSVVLPKGTLVRGWLQ